MLTYSFDATATCYVRLAPYDSNVHVVHRQEKNMDFDTFDHLGSLNSLKLSLGITIAVGGDVPSGSILLHFI